MAADRPIGVYQGDRYQHTLVLTDAAGDPVDVSAGSWAAQIRRYPGDAAAAATFTVDSSGAAGGTVVLSLGTAVTAGLDAGSYRWDVDYTDGSSRTTYLAGDVTVTAEVTRG